MKKGQTSSLVVFTVILFVIGLIVNYVPFTFEGGKSLADYVAEILGINVTDVYFPNFIWWFLLPLVSTTAIILALMNFVTGWIITDKNLNLVIAFTWALIAILTPARYVVWGIFAFLGIWGIAVYGFIFIFGTYILARAFKRAPEKFMTLDIEAKRAQLSKRLTELIEEHSKAMNSGDTARASELARKIDSIKHEIEYLDRLSKEIATGR
ncbi:MAG: hypothetical protein QXQ77_00730 [Candidatus Aenigmatarchaeota archaeon]